MGHFPQFIYVFIASVPDNPANFTEKFLTRDPGFRHALNIYSNHSLDLKLTFHTKAKGLATLWQCR